MSGLRTCRTRRLSIAALIVAAMAALSFTGGLRSFEHSLQDALASWREQPASGKLHIVEMDAASVATIERWPWSRHHYAKVIDRLSEAGVRLIVFDVDFSSASTPAKDKELADAIARSKSAVVLPTFAQRASFGSNRALDALPIEMLRSHAALASVSVRPDDDGVVRRMPLGTITQDVPRPSLSAQIAGRSGSADSAFPIDFSIDADTIPRHSFVAIENGRFDRQALRGKDVLIGATAIEMGDRYVVPRNGVIPGVIAQALAAETLYREVPVSGGWFPLLALAGLLTAWILAARSRSTVVRRSLLGAVTIVMAKLGTAAASVYVLELAPALGAVALAGVVQAVVIARNEAMSKRMVDAESGLPNMRAFERRSVWDCRYTVAAMIDDFDALKSVLGEAHLGQLITRLADRLRVTGVSHEVFRIDDRVLSWTASNEAYELEECLEGLRALMRAPVEIAGRRVDVSLYYGIAGPGAAAEAAHAASVALREAKTWHYHEIAGKAVLEEQVSLMGELDQAISNGELEVLYQPKLSLTEDRITSAEALVRWNHPERGALRPDTFIPMAEQNDRIADLTLFVLNRTIDDLGEWCAAGLDVRAAVNISAKLVTSAAFIAKVSKVLAHCPVPRSRLIFEITESAAIADPKAAVANLNRFRDLGIAISMDDYGTGQSSLAYLQKLPLSELKIDRSFVQFAHRDTNDALLVRSTVQLAHALGLQVVAEGVEDSECLDFLRSINCDYAQGYFVGRPMPATDLREAACQPQKRAA